MHRKYWMILGLLVTVGLGVSALLVLVVGVGSRVAEAPTVASDLTPAEARITRLRHSVRDNPTDFDSRLRLGFAYQQAEQYSQALEQYDRILMRRPRSMATLYYRAVIYREMGADIQSRDSLRAVLAIRDDHVLAAKALGEYHLERTEYSRVLDIVKPAVKKHPKVGELQYLMGRGYQGVGKVEKASTCYLAAVEYSPDLLEARNRLRTLRATD